MVVSGIHQVAAGIVPRDAISHHVLAARELFRGWGLRSEAFADGVAPELADRVHHAGALREHLRPGDLVVIHYSIDSPAFSLAERSGGRLVLHYHNITPPEQLWRHAPRTAVECARGRQVLAGYPGRVVASCADSAYNARELEDLGFVAPCVTGLLHADLPIPPPRPRRDGPPRILFVGRGAPNKAQRDLVLALASMHEGGLPARMTLAGSWSISPSYLAECQALARRLGVEDALTIAGSVDDASLGELYRDADAFLCLSDHEGFCVPLVEAMRAGLPIVAYASSAVPETLGAAGLLLEEKTPSLVAEAVAEVLTNQALRDTLAAGRAERLDALGGPATEARLRAFFEGIGEP